MVASPSSSRILETASYGCDPAAGVAEVTNAYSKGARPPLNIQAIANVKVSTDPMIRNNAIERFLGRDNQRLLSCQGKSRGEFEKCTGPAHPRAGE